MSYQDIYQRLTALGTLSRGSTVTLDRTMLGDAISSEMMLQVLGTDSLSLNLQYHSIEAEVTVLQGFCTVLSITDAEYKLQLDSRAGDFTMTLELALPSTWKFSTSFPELPAQLVESKGVKSLRPNILDTLSMGVSKLIFSNRDLNHEGTELVRGLNFTGECYYSGLLFGLGTYIDFPGPVPMSGPVMRYREAGDVSFAGVSLTGNLQFDGSLGGLEVQRTLLRIKSAVKADHVDWSVDIDKQAGVYFLMETQLMGRDMQLIGRLSDGKQLDLSCVFTDFAMANLGAISQSTGGDETELSGALPSDASSPQGIHITDMSLGIDFKARKVKYIGLGVGMQVSWSVVPGAIELENVGVRVKVGNPFEGSKRVFQVTLLGTFALGDARVGLSGTYPGYEVAGQLISGELKVGAALDRYLPGVTALADMRISKLVAMASPTAKTYTLVCQIEDLLTIPVGSSTLEFNELSLFLNRANGSTSGMFSARLGLGSADFVLSGTMGNQYMLSGTAENLSLHELLDIFTNGATIPEEVPEVLFQELNVQYAQSGDFTLTASAVVDMDTLPFDSSLSASVSLAVSRQSGNWTVNLTLSGTGAVNFAEGFRMDSYALNFSYGSTSGWSLGGTVGATIADKAVSLTAAYVNTTGVNKFSLSATSSTNVKILDVSGYFIFSWKRFDMAIEKTVVEGQADRKSWSLRLDSRVSVPTISTFDSTAEIAVDSEGKRMIKIKPLTIKAYNHTIADGVGISFKPKELCLTKESNATGWKLVGAADLGITGVTGKLGKALPSALRATVTLGKGEAKVELVNPMNPIDFPLPKADGQSLGKFVLQIMKIGVTLKPTLGFTAELGLGFPKELNTYFKRQVFREYEAGNAMSMSQLTCSVSGAGIGLQFITSPFVSGNTTKAEGGEDWINFDFGDCGEIAMKMPSFKYNMASSYFEASGGFKIVRDLSLPLTPLRNFLDGVGMGAAKAIFPEKLPIKGISLVDANDNFKTEDLITMLGDIPNEVKSALRGAGNLLNRFPDGFKSYLKFEIPSELSFKFGFSPLGRVSFALSAPAEPIRFLYPGMVQGLVPMPGLIGIELRKLNIGTLASGSLFFGDIDAVIDMYDLPSLVTSLALPTDPGFPLPTSDQLQRRIILKNVFSIIPLSQGVPVPVPVFHDEIGFEYMGLEGIGIQAHMGIPQPDFAAGGTELLKTFVTFFKDRSYKLDPNKAPGGQQIKFRFRDEYLQAPEYLGGGKVGTSDKVIEIGTWKYVAQLMNFCKRFVLTDLVSALPVENRSMNKSAKLGPFEVEGTYLITTTEEFDNGAYGTLKLNSVQAKDFKDVLPGVQLGSSNGSDGLIMFLRGAVKATTVFDLQASFGLAASGTMGFGTGFKFNGKLGGFVEAELRGAVLLNAPELGTGSSTSSTTQVATSYPAAKQVTVPAPVAAVAYKRGHDLALQLNGSSTKIILPYHAALNNKEFTAEIWAKVEAFTTERITLMGKRDAQWRLNVLKSGHLEYSAHIANGNVQRLMATSSPVLTFGSWTHLAISWNGQKANLFVNGKPVLEIGIPEGLTNDESEFLVGRDMVGSNLDYVKGAVTELRLWRYPRTSAELQDTMLTRLSGREVNLVAYYPLDADNGSVAYDAVGQGHGTITDRKYDVARFHIMDGMDFDGDGDYISIPALGNFKPGAFMLEVLLRPDLRSGSGTMGVLGSNSTPEMSTTLVPLYGQSPNVLQPGKFYSIVQAVNQQGKGYYYLNGRYVSDWNNTGSGAATTIRLDIGKSGRVELPSFHGRIYEVRVHNVKLGETYVLQNHNKYRAVDDSTIIAHFKLGKAQGGVLDSERGDIRANVYVKPKLKQVQLGGLRFTDGNQYGHLPLSDKYCGTGMYTVEAWVKPDVVDASSRFIVRGIQYAPRIATANGNVSARWYDAANGFRQLDSPGGLLKAGQWQHIAASWNGSMMALYVNGVEVKKGSYTGGLQKGATELALGRRELNKTTENYLGSIAELRFWNTGRTGAEIAKYMGLQLLGNEPGLVAYYPLTLVDTNPVQDYGPHGLHGKLTGISPSMTPVVKGSTSATTTPTTATTGGDRKCIQAIGHSHLRIGGREVMVADMRLSDNEFWFKGKINLFPSNSSLKVAGLAEALIKKDSLYLYAESEVALFGMTLTKSKMLITHQMMRIEGQFLGINTLLDVAWTGNDPHFTGRIWAEYSRTFDIGAVYISGVRVCDNYRIHIDVGFDIGLDVTKSAFKAHTSAKFMVAGLGFEYSFTVGFAPTDLHVLGDYLRDELAANAWKYFSHIFQDAIAYVDAALDASIEFLSNTASMMGNALNHAYNQTIEQAGQILADAEATAGEAAGCLADGWDATEAEVAHVCQSIGYTVDEIATGLKEIGRDVEEVGQALAGLAGTTSTTVANALHAAGYTLEEASHALESYLGNQWKEILNALDEAWDDLDVVKCLRRTWNKSMQEIAGWHKELSYAAQKSFDAIKSAWAASERAVSQVMKNVGYTCNQVAGMLKKYLGGDAAGQVLKDIGFSKDEVMGALKGVYGWTTDQVDDWVDTVGGWISNGGGVVNDLGDWISSL